MADLFGNPEPPERHVFKDGRVGRRGPKGGKHYVQPAGYVMKPGTGPAGETCGSCKHICRKRMSKTYIKCGLARAIWTGGRRSDILASAPACSKWEKSNDHE